MKNTAAAAAAAAAAIEEKDFKPRPEAEPNLIHYLISSVVHYTWGATTVTSIEELRLLCWDF